MGPELSILSVSRATHREDRGYDSQHQEGLFVVLYNLQVKFQNAVHVDVINVCPPQEGRECYMSVSHVTMVIWLSCQDSLPRSQITFYFIPIQWNLTLRTVSIKNIEVSSIKTLISTTLQNKDQTGSPMGGLNCEVPLYFLPSVSNSGHRSGEITPELHQMLIKASRENRVDGATSTRVPAQSCVYTLMDTVLSPLLIPTTEQPVAT